MSSIAVDGSALPPDPENVPYDQRPDVYGWPRTDENGYTIKEQPSGTRKPLRVVVAGAGASGINFAKFAREELEDVQVNIFDKNNDVGGTWLENRYPYADRRAGKWCEEFTDQVTQRLCL
jgi:NADPH-dependent 2,4-dienoyl-CoA reductase/sulfur reductase-like enzyme